MNKPDPEGLAGYYKAAETWTDDRDRDAARSKRVAWLVAGAACTPTSVTRDSGRFRLGSRTRVSGAADVPDGFATATCCGGTA